MRGMQTWIPGKGKGLIRIEWNIKITDYYSRVILVLFHTTDRNDIWNDTLHVTVWRRYKNIR